MNSRPNILFLPKWYPHDADPFDGNFVENHAHAIKKICKLSVLFVHSEERNEGDLYRLEEKDNDGIRELRVYFKKAKGPIGVVNRLINLNRYKKTQQIGYEHLYKNSKPDLVHIHVLARSSFLALRLQKQGIPFVITEHWSGYLPESGALQKSGKAFWYRNIANKAKAIHTVSQHLANAMQSHGIKNDFKVIPNVVKEDLFVPSERKVGEKVNVLYVGNLLQHPKRILDIIDTFKEISDSRTDFHFRIYGEGKEMDEMLQRIERYNLGGLIEYCGTTDRNGIAKAMAESDFLFLFSEFENQPCVINEALCCGIPVVVPNIEGIVEFMKDEFGLIFPRNDQEAFKNTIIKMMNDHSNYNPKKTRELALKQFSEDSIAGEFEEFYRTALSK